MKHGKARPPVLSAAEVRREKLKAWGLMVLGGLLIALGALFQAVSAAEAKSLGEMFKEAAADLDQIPLFLEIAFYLAGVVVFFIGVVKLKRHVDYPQQTSFAGGVVALLVGMMLIAAPSVINGLSDTFGLDSADTTLDRPRLQ